MNRIITIGHEFGSEGRELGRRLAEKKPFRIFRYADMESKMKRCREKAPEHEHLS